MSDYHSVIKIELGVKSWYDGVQRHECRLLD